MNSRKDLAFPYAGSENPAIILLVRQFSQTVIT